MEQKGGDMAATTILNAKGTDQVAPDGEQVLLRNPYGAEFTATVQFESFSAITVKGSRGKFDIGDALDVEYGGAVMRAFVNRFDGKADGTWLLVLQWGGGES
jgi:hypothetical protein